MRLSTIIFVTAACLLAQVGNVAARTLNVPGEYGTIGAAVAASRDGDSVLVEAGRYTGDGNVNTRIRTRITVLSVEGPIATIIDGEVQQSMSGFTMATGSQIFGFTLTRMTLYCIYDTSTQNTRISDCIFLQNVNEANNQGVGVRVSNATGFSIDHCIFNDNRAGSGGGGLCMNTGVTGAKVWNCLFIGNRTTKFGGGLTVTGSSDADIGNCIFQGNFSAIDGGAVAFTINSRGTVRNCTFIQNNADNGYGGGLYKGSNSNPTVINSIFWGNAGANGNNLGQQNAGGGAGGSITVSYCDIENADNNGEQNGGWSGTHILNGEPGWVEGREPQWGINWMYLDPESPCVDAGSAQASAVGMDTLFTNPDFSSDTGLVDLGFHYDLDSYLRVGELRGTVTRAIDEQPLFGTIVRTSHRMQTVTNEAGYWSIPNHKIGPVTISFSCEGFLDSVITDTLEEEEVIRRDIALLHTEFNPTIRDIDVRIVKDSSQTIDFLVQNPGSGTLTYTATPRLVGAYDRDPWVQRETFSFGQTADDDRLNGFVAIDSLFYVAGANAGDSSLIYIFNREGALVDSFEQAVHTHYGFKQLAWDGDLIWGSGDSLIYGFTRTGELRQMWRGPFSPNENIAWDSDRQILWISSTTTDIAGYDREGNDLGRRFNRRGLKIYGLEYWPGDPDQHSLYILNRPSGNLNKLTKLDVETGDTLFVTMVQEPNGNPLLGAQIVTYDLFSVVFISLGNIAPANGNDMLEIWQLAANTSWMDITPSRGDVAPGGEQAFQVRLNMMGFPSRATYEGQILFTHNALDFEYRMPIIVDVYDYNDVPNSDVPPVPSQLSIKTVSPNPFNGTARIEYTVPAAGKVTLAIFDLAGREISRTAQEWTAAGRHAFTVDASAWPSSIYVAKLEAAGDVRTAKLVLMK